MGDKSVPQSNSRRLPWDTSSKGHQHAGPTEPGGVRDVAEGSLYAGAIWIPGGPATQICPAHTQDVFKVVQTTSSSAQVHLPGEAFHLPAISARHVYHPGRGSTEEPFHRQTSFADRSRFAGVPPLLRPSMASFFRFIPIVPPWFNGCRVSAGRATAVRREAPVNTPSPNGGASGGRAWSSL